MQFKFIGQGPKDAKPLESFEAFGITFPPGEWVDVDDDCYACGRLTGHSHYAARSSEKTEEVDEELETLRNLAKEKGIDRVGVKGKEKLLAELAELENGNQS